MPPPPGRNQPPNRLPKLQRPTPHADAVLSTFELLELILLHVDLRTVLVSCQRVSRRWHTIIASSPPLQRHLFLLPSLDTPSPSSNSSSNSVPSPKLRLIQNPLLKAAFPCLFDIESWGHEPWQVAEGVLPCCCGFRSARIFNYGEPNKREWLPMGDMREGKRRHLAFVRKGASWQRMLVSQPAPVMVARVGSVLDVRGPPPPRPRRGLFRNFPPRRYAPRPPRDGWILMMEEGLRMEELFDAVTAINRVYMTSDGNEYEKDYGAWVAWKGTKEMAACRHVQEGVPVDVGASPVRWLAAADLVIGEHNETSGSSGCKSHYCGGVQGRTCFLNQGSRLEENSKYLCEEYEPKGRLWLVGPVIHGESEFEWYYLGDSDDEEDGEDEGQRVVSDGGATGGVFGENAGEGVSGLDVADIEAI
ncbi:hypothetical protein VTI74DRAFT_9923 [Chaetomium olivicolor]